MSQTDSNVAIKDATKIQMTAPQYPLDQVIGYFSGSVSIALGGPGGAQTFASATRQTGFADSCLMKGIYSVDNGANWTDLGDSILNGDDAVAGQLYLQSGFASFLDGSVVINWGNTTKSAYTILYKVILLAKDDQKKITTIPTVPVLSYTTKYNYMKIAFQGKVVLAASASLVIPHGLNTVPNFLAWRTSDSAALGDNLALSAVGSRGGAVITNTALTLTNTDSSNSRTFYYRIYLDA